MLTILVAHHAEGQPFITHYNMKADKADSGGRRYVGDAVYLRIVGQGGENARRSLIEELSTNVTGAEQRWLNFGVAGSAEHAVPEIVEVTVLNMGDSDTNAPEYRLQHRGLAPASDCRSFAMPQNSYPPSGVVDMEAYSMAAELASRSLLADLLVIKQVVDGPSEPYRHLTPALLKSQLHAAQTTLTEISDRLIMSR